MLSKVFLISAIVELVAGTALLTFYDNPIGYLGLIASICFGAVLPFLEDQGV